jgi:Fe-S cluster biogenesis protein NfuA
VHVFDLREIGKDDGLVREKRGGQAGQGGILVPARLDPPFQREAALYCILVHGLIIVSGDGRSSEPIPGAGRGHPAPQPRAGSLYFASLFHYVDVVPVRAILPQRSFEMLKERVLDALNEIRPALEADGGDVELVDVSEQGVVKVRLTGACRGCPMGMQTLKLGIEKHIKQKVPEVSEVVGVIE